MARTRDRFEFSCSPTITTVLYSVSANWTEKIVDMNTDSEADNTEEESKEDTEDLEVDNTEEESKEDTEVKLEKIDDGDDIEASLEEIED